MEEMVTEDDMDDDDDMTVEDGDEDEDVDADDDGADALLARTRRAVQDVLGDEMDVDELVQRVVDEEPHPSRPPSTDVLHACSGVQDILITGEVSVPPPSIPTSS